MSNCLRRAETNVVLIGFMGVLHQVRTHTATVFNITLHMIQVPDICWSVTRAYERGVQPLHRSGARRSKKGPVNL
jgi:hypothetical protein